VPKRRRYVSENQSLYTRQGNLIRIRGQLHTTPLLDTITMSHRLRLCAIHSISTINSLPLIMACTNLHCIICNIINRRFRILMEGILLLHLLQTWTRHIQRRKRRSKDDHVANVQYQTVPIVSFRVDYAYPMEQGVRHVRILVV